MAIFIVRSLRLQSSFDTSFDCERPSSDRWYSKDLPTTLSRALNRGIPNMHSPSSIRTLIVDNESEFEEDDSDEGISELLGQPIRLKFTESYNRNS